MWEGLRVEPSSLFPFAMIRYRLKLFVWTLPYTNPNSEWHSYTVSKVIICQTCTVDMLCWKPYSRLLQDGFKDDVVGAMQDRYPHAGTSAICKSRWTAHFWFCWIMNLQVGLLFFDFLFFFFLSSCLLIASSLPSAHLHFSLWSIFHFCFYWIKFLMLPIETKL